MDGFDLTVSPRHPGTLLAGLAIHETALRQAFSPDVYATIAPWNLPRKVCPSRRYTR